MEYVEISKVIDIELGKTPSRNNTDYWNGENTWITIADMTQKYIEESKEKITDIAIKNTKIKKVPQNTVIMSFKLSIGKRAITKAEVYTNEAIAAFHIKDLKSLIPEYLYYALESVDFLKYTDKAVKGKTLNKEKLKKIRIPIFSLSVQLKISEILNKIQKIIKNKRKQIFLFDELIKSRFIEMFGDPIKNEKGWEVKKLYEVSDVRDGTHDSPKYIEIGIPLVTSKNIKKDGISFENVNFISEEDYNNINKRSKVDNGDIIMPMIGTIGNPIIINTDKKFSIKNVCLIKFTNIKLINYYCKYLFSREFIKTKTNFRGGTQKFISLKDIRNIEIPLPPLTLQNEFAEFVTKTNKLKFEAEKSLKEMENLYESLMQKFFKQN